MSKVSFFMCLIVMCLASFSSVLAADSLVFQDDFSHGLASNWITGTNTAINTAPEVTVNEGRVEWTQRYDFIETKASYSGDFRVEVDLERTQASVACKDFVIEFVSERSVTGILRLSYGTNKFNVINMGQGPSLDSETDLTGVCVDDETGYRRDMEAVSPLKGTAILMYTDNKVKFVFVNHAGAYIETPAVSVAPMASTKIRIWATTSFRFVDAVRVYSGTSSEYCECSDLDMTTADINIPCLTIGPEIYALKMTYDPQIPNGYYWKLDVNSIHLVQ